MTKQNTASPPPANFADPMSDLPPDQQKALLSTERVFTWLNNMPSLDIVRPVVGALIEAANKLDNEPSTPQDREMIAGWVDDLMSFLYLTQLFARGHMSARAGKDDSGAPALMFAPTVLGKKYFEAQASMQNPYEEKPEEQHDGAVPPAAE